MTVRMPNCALPPEILCSALTSRFSRVVFFAFHTNSPCIFEPWLKRLPHIEVYGSDGSLSVPDPNTFGGPVLLKTRDEAEWREVPLALPFATNSRGLGLSEMMRAVEEGRPHRASGALGMHALEIMHAIHDASGTGKSVTLRYPCPRPAALEQG